MLRQTVQFMARRLMELDGVYRCGADHAPAFVEVGAPTDDELHGLLQTIVARLRKMLTRRGALVEDMDRPAWPGRMPTVRRRERCRPRL